MSSKPYAENKLQRYARTRLQPQIDRMGVGNLVFLICALCFTGLVMLMVSVSLQDVVLFMASLACIAIAFLQTVVGMFTQYVSNRHEDYVVSYANAELKRLHEQRVAGTITADEYDTLTERLNRLVDEGSLEPPQKLSHRDVWAMKAGARRFAHASDKRIERAMRKQNLSR